jgi:hypothetical protein
MDVNEKVANIIVADSLEHAQENTGLTCIEVTEETLLPCVGYEFFNGIFRPIKPDANSEWNETAKTWQTPII